MNEQTKLKIARILSGSCTPACDIESMILNGEVTREEADAAYGANRRGVRVTDGAIAERAFINAMDI